MDSKTSEPKHPTPVETETVMIPKIPQEIIDEILDYLATNSAYESLRSCALVSKSWVPSCRRHLFYTTFFTSRDMTRWLKTFPVPAESPAHHVRELRFSIAGFDTTVPERFSGHISWFTNAESVTFGGEGPSQSLWIPPFWSLPQSITSLTLSANGITLSRVQDVMAKLPNLQDLSLSGVLTLMSMGAFLWETAPRRLGGKLLLNGLANKYVMDMLLEIPTGLHFTEIQARGARICLLSTVMLAEACSRTLEKLTYAVSIYYGREASERSFDFSEFPNLQEVNFRVGWKDGDLLWIAVALSTLKPTTSPRLSVVRLDFTCSLVVNQAVETLIEYTGNDLRWIADEVSRIEREFGGAVDLEVHRDSAFEDVLDGLNILRH